MRDPATALVWRYQNDLDRRKGLERREISLLICQVDILQMSKSTTVISVCVARSTFSTDVATSWADSSACGPDQCSHGKRIMYSRLDTDTTWDMDGDMDDHFSARR
jgi:hypothetical protein